MDKRLEWITNLIGGGAELRMLPGHYGAIKPCVVFCCYQALVGIFGSSPNFHLFYGVVDRESPRLFMRRSKWRQSDDNYSKPLSHLISTG